MNALTGRTHFRVWITFLFSICIICAFEGAICAQSSKRVGKHNLQIPEDWPVEKRGGLIVPIPTEEYVSMKFSGIETEFQSIENEFFGKLEDLEASLKNVEDNFQKELKKLRSLNEEQIESSAKVTSFLTGLGLLRDTVDQLNIMLSRNIKDLEVKLKSIDQQLEFINDNLDGLQTQIYRLDEKIDYFHDGSKSY